MVQAAPIGEVVQPQQRIIGGFFLPKNSSDKNQKNIEIDYSKFLQDGVIQYKPLKGVVRPGIQFTRDDNVSSSTLNLQYKLRFGTAVTSVLIGVVASCGLVIAGLKLFASSLFDQGSEEDAYQSLSRSYTTSSVAGVLTGLAHESPTWALGNLGMGIFSRYLHDIGGLAGFLFSDGLSSIGMGQVRYREKGNAFTVQNSIFNNPALSFLGFLKPVEQSIYSFAKMLSNPKEWKLLKEIEPYALFNSAGGGLALSGGVLGLFALVKNKLSDGIKSFAYLPAAIFSLGSLIAFFRDGAVEVDRSHYIGGGKRQAENIAQRLEGYSKEVASPFLAIRNFLFGLKGLGLDTSGTLHSLAIGAQAFGAAFAFLGFTAQSVLKFFKPELFGPIVKQFREIILEPKIAIRELKRIIDLLSSKEGEEKYKIKDEVIQTMHDENLRDEYAGIFKAIMNTGTFKSKYDISQAGLPNYTNEKTFSRFYLDRGTHLERALYIVRKLYQKIEGNLKEQSSIEPLNYFRSKKLALYIAALLHDIGHGPFSHVLDKAWPGYDNDRETILMLRDENSEIHQAILKACKEANIDGKETVSDILEILGRWSPLYQLVSGWGADRIDYIRFSDFPLMNNGRVLFPKWTLKDLDNYANTFRLFKDANGKPRVGFTPEGALIAFLMCSDRQLFDVLANNTPAALPIDLLAAIGLADVPPNEIRNKSEEELAKIIQRNIEKLKKGESVINVKQYTGGRNGYSYYSSIPDDPTCIHVVNGEVTEFLKYINKRGIKQYLDELAKSSEIFKKYPISEHELLSRIKAATTLHEYYSRVQVRS